MQLDEQSGNVESGEGGVIDSHWSSVMKRKDTTGGMFHCYCAAHRLSDVSSSKAYFLFAKSPICFRTPSFLGKYFYRSSRNTSLLDVDEALIMNAQTNK